MASVIIDKKRIGEVLDRGVVVEILPSREEFERKLTSDRLRIYYGVDPTSDSLHLSHAKNFMLLEEFRQLGHEVIVLVGDFTAQIGDPTGRESARTHLTEQQVKENVKKWLEQIKPLMDFGAKENPPQVKYNSEWLSSMAWKDEVKLASNLTVQRMMERDMFQKRLKNNVPIYLHEFEYPLMQGYDSVAMDVDAELCGTDQIFNAHVGRTLLKRLKNKDKFIVAVNLMENPKTRELMSKSKGAGVFLSSPPKEMFGAIMAQPDEMIEVLFVNVTRLPLSDKESIMKLGPRDAKMLIAHDIVKRFYGGKEAIKARDEWEKVFSKKELPSEMEEIESDELVKIVRKVAGSSSGSAKGLIDQGAVEVNGDAKKEWKFIPQRGDIVQIGPKKFVKIK